MNKSNNNTKTTTITSIMAGIIMVVSTVAILFAVGVTNNMMIITPAYAGEKYDPEHSYTVEECAEMFDPYYDRENFLACSGSIGGGPRVD